MPAVYILTNECMPDIVKIGFSETSLVRRIREMDKTEIPLPFECYYAVEVPDSRALEKKIHQGLDDCRVRRGREIFLHHTRKSKVTFRGGRTDGWKKCNSNDCHC